MSALNRVLLIEDNPGDARLVLEYLRERFGDDCALQEAGSLQAGLKHLQATSFDVVLLDLGLPDSRGLDTFFQVTAVAPNTPVVILTGNDDSEAGVEALEAGADDYLAKQNADSAALVRAMRHAVQRRHMAARLRESEARYRAIVETAEEPIVHAESDGTIVLANARAASLLCAPAAERSASPSLVGRSLYEFVEAGQVQALQTLVQTATGQRGSHELQLRRDDGAAIWVKAAAKRTASADTPRGAVVLLFSDVTERRGVQAELQALQREFETRVDDRTASLQALNADLEAFSFSVAHDLRTPLNGILGFAALMQQDEQHPLATPQRRRLQIIEDSARGMDALIAGLLQLARLGRQAMVLEPLDLSALAHTIAATLQAAEPARAVQWQIEPGLRADGDKRLLEVVLGNLLGNAWKYSASSSPALIEFGRVPETGVAAMPTYFLRDNGIGFDPGHAEGLFTPFYRAPSAQAYAGSGIGLANVRRAVNRHGGSVWAEGQAGAGACFYFTLQGTAMDPEP